MAKQKHTDIWIDRLTNSIENTISGESFPTVISLVTYSELKSVTKTKGWNFNWKAELKKNDHQVYKLTTRDNPTIIHGLVSLKMEEDHVFVSIIAVSYTHLKIISHYKKTGELLKLNKPKVTSKSKKELFTKP